MHVKKFPKCDLVIKGSVAVDLQGNRLGKGGGYGDREVAFMLQKNLITKDTPITTTVHDLQIAGKIPAEEHDLKVSIIVTPKKVYYT